MNNGNEFNYRQKSDIKLIMDVFFLLILLVLIIVISAKQAWTPVSVISMLLLFIAYLSQYFWSKNWLPDMLLNLQRRKRFRTYPITREAEIFQVALGLL